MIPKKPTGEPSSPPSLRPALAAWGTGAMSGVLAMLLKRSSVTPIGPKAPFPRSVTFLQANGKLYYSQNAGCCLYPTFLHHPRILQAAQVELSIALPPR